MRVRLCIQAQCLSCRIAASTMGNPVFPSHHASNWVESYSHSKSVNSGLKHLFILEETSVITRPHSFVVSMKGYLPYIGPMS